MLEEWLRYCERASWLIPNRSNLCSRRPDGLVFELYYATNQIGESDESACPRLELSGEENGSYKVLATSFLPNLILLLNLKYNSFVVEA